MVTARQYSGTLAPFALGAWALAIARADDTPLPDRMFNLLLTFCAVTTVVAVLLWLTPSVLAAWVSGYQQGVLDTLECEGHGLKSRTPGASRAYTVEGEDADGNH